MPLTGETIFIAGAYGVGKSTIGAYLSKKTNVPFYSAGSLISEVYGEEYGANKVVKDKEKNQNILIYSVNELHKKFGKIFLAGHFCIFNSSNDVEQLPDTVFDNLKISTIVLLEAEPSVVSNLLWERDGKSYSVNSLADLTRRERKQAEKTSNRLHCPLLIYKRHFTDDDFTNILDYFTEGIS